jgi:uncharacterized protein YggT (Ycf19 family)
MKDNQTEPTTTTEAPNSYKSYSVRNNLAHLVELIGSIIMLLLAIRFFFILFAANPLNGFVNFIYQLSYPLARPFFGIFNYHIKYGISRVEFASLIAIVIYGIIAYIITRLLTIEKE